MKRRIRFIITAILLAGGLFVGAKPAAAHQTPGACDSNQMSLSFARDKLVVSNGDVLTYTVTLSNLSGAGHDACDFTSVDIVVTLPAADGTPTGDEVILITDLPVPAEMPVTPMGSVQYTVAVNSGVTDIVAQARTHGTLHDAPVDHDAEIIKTIGTAVVWLESEEEEEQVSEEEENEHELPPQIVIPRRMPNTGTVHA